MYMLTATSLWGKMKGLKNWCNFLNHSGSLWALVVSSGNGTAIFLRDPEVKTLELDILNPKCVIEYPLWKLLILFLIHSIVGYHIFYHMYDV